MKAVYLITFILMSGCSSGNLDYVKERANSKFREIGFVVVGYEGYQWGFWGLSSYGGAKVWYRLEKLNPNGTTNGISYTGYIQRWGTELHVYGPIATDAIKP